MIWFAIGAALSGCSQSQVQAPQRFVLFGDEMEVPCIRTQDGIAVSLDAVPEGTWARVRMVQKSQPDGTALNYCALTWEGLKDPAKPEEKRSSEEIAEDIMATLRGMLAEKRAETDRIRASTAAINAESARIEAQTRRIREEAKP
jgi:hypothetical protein